MLRQRFIYGDDGEVSDPAALNMQGRLHRHFDEAGVIEISRYDFKGNVLTQSRRAIADSAFVAAIGGSTPTFQVDWEDAEQETALEARVYQTDSTFDALNRIHRVTLPEDVSDDRKMIVPFYASNNALERVNVFEQNGGVDRPFIMHIAYNARGQRGLIAYGIFPFSYDPCGNLTAKDTSRRFDWNHSNRLARFQDPGGQRRSVNRCVLCIRRERPAREEGCPAAGRPREQHHVRRKLVRAPSRR
jgi:hypothetical protein